ncbi:MAG: hypothetical protein IJB68_10295 [Ruminococcus sp.]|nr:hypothetical protein [Ruminococcus sp.]
MVTEENEEIQATMPDKDTTEYLETEEKRRRREGLLEDIPAMQGILCLLLAVGLILMNIRFPDMAEELFLMVKDFSSSENELFENPIELLEELCRK